jgi:hypothetical protein
MGKADADATTKVYQLASSVPNPSDEEQFLTASSSPRKWTQVINRLT